VKTVPRLKQVREDKLMTQSELAVAAGVHEMTISRLERGDQAQFATVKKLARALKVKPDQLCSVDDPVQT
jgi:transcriptional regulator with XRE-family HTH domain